MSTARELPGRASDGSRYIEEKRRHVLGNDARAQHPRIEHHGDRRGRIVPVPARAQLGVRSVVEPSGDGAKLARDDRLVVTPFGGERALERSQRRRRIAERQERPRVGHEHRQEHADGLGAGLEVRQPARGRGARLVPRRREPHGEAQVADALRRAAQRVDLEATERGEARGVGPIELSPARHHRVERARLLRRGAGKQAREAREAPGGRSLGRRLDHGLLGADAVARDAAQLGELGEHRGLGLGLRLRFAQPGEPRRDLAPRGAVSAPVRHQLAQGLERGRVDVEGRAQHALHVSRAGELVAEQTGEVEERRESGTRLARASGHLLEGVDRVAESAGRSAMLGERAQRGGVSGRRAEHPAERVDREQTVGGVDRGEARELGAEVNDGMVRPERARTRRGSSRRGDRARPLRREPRRAEPPRGALRGPRRARARAGPPPEPGTRSAGRAAPPAPGGCVSPPERGRRPCVWGRR